MNSIATAFAAGLGAGFSLIVAIGAQNAFVLRQGLARQHIGWVVLLCSLSDALLITLGVLGIGVIIETVPALVTAIGIGGGVFLIGYAVTVAHRALHAGALTADGRRASVPLATTVATCLALTWLNPHVYLDTVVLLGSVANTFPRPERWFLAAGAVLASLIWFTGLGYGARLLGPVFARRTAWRVLDTVIAVIMAVLGTVLLVNVSWG